MEYETERQRHIVPVMATVDSLNRLYTSSFAPFILARTLGLQAVNSVNPVKVNLHYDVMMTILFHINLSFLLPSLQTFFMEQAASAS